MKFLFRWAFRLFLVITVLVVALVLCKDALLKSFAEYRVRSQTGLDLRIGKLSLALFSPTLSVEDLKLYNPAEFGGAAFLDIPDLHLQYDPAALAWRRLRLPLVRVWLAEMNVVEAKDGRTNIAGVFFAPRSTPRAGSNPSLFGLDFAGIETLNLTLGKVRYSSLRRPGRATEVEFGLRNAILTNIHSMADLTNAVMRTVLRSGIVISEPPAPRRGPVKPAKPVAPPKRPD